MHLDSIAPLPIPIVRRRELSQSDSAGGEAVPACSRGFFSGQPGLPSANRAFGRDRVVDQMIEASCGEDNLALEPQDFDFRARRSQGELRYGV